MAGSASTVRWICSAKSASVRIDSLLYPLAILDFDQAAAASHGMVKAVMVARGVVIGPLDWLIASHALSQHLVLITNNANEFNRVPGLSLEDWTRD